MRRVYSIALLLLVALGLSATTKEVKLKLLETSDIHGNFFPYNFIEQREWFAECFAAAIVVLDFRTETL